MKTITFKRFAAGAALFIACAVVLSSYSSMSVNISELQLAKASKGSFEIRVNSVGALEAARSHIVSSEIKGNKGKIIYLIEDGAWVEDGDVLIRFDPSAFEEEVVSLGGKTGSFEAVVDAANQGLSWEKSKVDREVKVANLKVKTAALDMDRLVNGDGPMEMASLKSELEKSRQELEKQRNFVKDLVKLEEKGFSNPAEIMLAKSKAEQLKDQHETSVKKYESYKNYILPSHIENAKINLNQAKIEADQLVKGGAFRIAKAMAAVNKAKHDLYTAQIKLKQAKFELEKTILLAPHSGIAVLYETYWNNVKRKPRVGDTVWQNQPILYLPDVSSFIVKMKIREIDLHKIHKGQKAEVRVDAYPAVKFTGTVATIGALAEDVSGNNVSLGREKYFELTVAIKGVDNRLRPGMTARVSVLSDTVKGALIIPLHSVFSEGDKKLCYKYSGGDYEKVFVKLGRKNEDHAEVLSGLAEGDALSLVEPGFRLF